MTLNYKIEGDDFQMVRVQLSPGETLRAEPGSFMWMENGIEMETSTGGGILSGLKRAIGGESFFITTFRNEGAQPASVAFSAPYPGKILTADMSRGTILAQRDCYLCSTPEVDVSVAFTRRFGAGLFGGEGFILQKLTGKGLAFLHASGAILERELQPGELLRVDTGCLVAFEQTVDYDIQMVRGIKTMLFGGEGLFYAAMRGPGKVWIQTTPFSRLANRVIAAAGASRGEHRRGGDLIGGLLGGDRS